HPRSLVSHFLQGVRDTTLSAYAHQAYPFDKLADEMNGDRDLSRNALFDVLVNHQFMESINDGFLKGRQLKISETAKLDLEFAFYESSNSLKGEVIYNTDLFNHDTAVLFSAQLIALLDALITAPVDKTVKDVVSLISIPDQELLLKGRGNEKNYPVHAGYTNLFFKQAAEFKNNTALRDSKNILSYARLAERSLAISHRLQQENVSPNPVIAVCLPRCCELTAIAIGIWHAGGIYMPLDASLPADRMAYMLEDSGAAFIITNEPMPGIALKQLNAQEFFASREINSTNETVADNIYNGSYLLYTSGSTGKPKGVLVSAAGMLNHMHSKCDDLQLNEESIIAQTASVSFDTSIWQIFAGLLAGACVRIYSKDEVLNMKQHLKQLQEDGITVAQMVPSYMREFIVEAEGIKGSQLPSLQYLLSIGEELDSSLAARCIHNFSAKLVNSYGPTEAADNISMHFINENEIGEKIPIGKALHNTQLYVVDELGHLCQPGIIGEICASGIGVAQGYIGNAKERSAEVFMEDPFTKGRWMYRTGDLGKWDAKQD
ncbi:MAG: AMP-binding protein, partial [Chitinophagaceae bacterium]